MGFLIASLIRTALGSAVQRIDFGPNAGEAGRGEGVVSGASSAHAAPRPPETTLAPETTPAATPADAPGSGELCECEMSRIEV
jgi:hypothetical protein